MPSLEKPIWRKIRFSVPDIRSHFPLTLVQYTRAARLFVTALWKGEERKGQDRKEKRKRGEERREEEDPCSYITCTVIGAEKRSLSHTFWVDLANRAHFFPSAFLWQQARLERSSVRDGVRSVCAVRRKGRRKHPRHIPPSFLQPDVCTFFLRVRTFL